MARIVWPGGPWTVEVEVERIDVTSDRPTPNERWHYTDAAGHAHHYESGYPTLRYVIDREHWCNGNEGMGPHDPHMAVDEAHYECPLCGETVEPALDPAGTFKSIPGPTRATMTGTRSDGGEATVWMTEADTERLRTSTDPNAVALELLDNDDRVTSLTYSR